jgi:transcriptional regulator with XRE-family HTH domain
MVARSKLTDALPFAVEEVVTRLGAGLRIARVRRGLTIADAAAKLGVSRLVVAAAERGKATTSIAVYASLLWAYGLLDHLSEVADPLRDEVGIKLASTDEKLRVRHPRALDNDF